MTRRTKLSTALLLLAFVIGCGGEGIPPDVGVDGSLDSGRDTSTDAAGDAALTTIPIRLVALSDLHGRLRAPAMGSGGAVHMARIVRELEEQESNTLVVAAGDMIGASAPLSGLLHDEPTIAVMNELGVDVAGVGNHEFDRTLGELRRLFEGGCHPDGCVLGDEWGGADFPLLGANVLDEETGEPVLGTHSVVVVGGVGVGFIGVTLEQTDEIVLASYVEGLRFAPEAATINALVPVAIAEGAEVIVALIHQGSRDESCATGALPSILASLDEAVDVVISGHTHQAYICDGDPLITQSGPDGRGLTVIDLSIDVATREVVDASATNRVVAPVDEGDAEMRAVLDAYAAEADPLLERVVGTIGGDITSASDEAHQSLGGFLVADAFLEGAAGEGAVIAMTNANGIRDHLLHARSGAESEDGQVTFGELYAVIPFSNTLVTMTLTGAQIERLLEDQLASGNSNWIQPSAGFAFTWQGSAPPGARVDPAEIMIGGVAIDLGAEYRVAVNNFIASGPAGYEVLTEGTDVAWGAVDTEVVSAYLGAHGPVAPPALDRVTAR